MARGLQVTTMLPRARTLTEEQVTQRILLTAGGLVLLGLALLVATIWWWRATREEHAALGPLEVMGMRRWRRASDAERRRLVAEARPPRARAVAPAVPEPVDLAVLSAQRPQGFDDLRELDELLQVLPGRVIDPSPPSPAGAADEADGPVEAGADAPVQAGVEPADASRTDGGLPRHEVAPDEVVADDASGAAPTDDADADPDRTAAKGLVIERAGLARDVDAVGVTTLAASNGASATAGDTVVERVAPALAPDQDAAVDGAAGAVDADERDGSGDGVPTIDPLLQRVAKPE